MPRTVLVTLLLLLLAPACDLFDDEDGATLGLLPFETVEAPSMQVLTPSTEVWRDAEAWAQFYCLHDLSAGPVCQVPSFDFERSMLIGVFWGGGYSGCSGHTESIETVERTRTSIDVTVGVPNDLGDCEAIVVPRQLILVDRSTRPVVFLGDVPG